MDSTSYVVGVDLGQSRDPTAIAVVRATGDPFMGEQIFQVGYLERLPLDTPYPAIISHVKSLLGRLPRGTELVIDYTGVGRPVFDLFELADLEPIGVLITGGTSETGDGRIYSVPKITLISGLQALLHEERLKIHRELPEAAILVSELQNFRVDFTASGHMTFNARSGTHDDLLLAAALGVWRARRASGGPMLSYYKSEIEQARKQDRDGKADFDRLPWHRPAPERREDIEDLYHDVYLPTLNGMIAKGVLCDTCGKRLGSTRINDGLNMWCPTCPPPGMI